MAKILNPFSSVTPALVQSSTGSYGGSGSNTEAFGSSTTLGNLLIACAGNNTSGTGTNTPTCSDTGSNTWTLAANQVITSTNAACCLFYAIAKGGASTVTIGRGSGAGAGANFGLTVAEFSGVSTLDQSGTNSATTGSTWTSNSITTLFPLEVLVGIAGNAGGSLAVNSPFGVLGSGNSFAFAYYQIVSTIQSGVSASGTQSSGNIVDCLCSFYAPSVSSANSIICGS